MASFTLARWRSGSASIAVWVVSWLTLAPLAVWGQGPSELLRQTIEDARDGSDVQIAGNRLVAVGFLSRFYAARRFEPAWVDPVNVTAALRIISTSDEHGLRPEDFHMDAIRLLQAMLAEQPGDARINVNLDLLLTDGLVTFAYQLVYGKVDPRVLTPSWNLTRPLLQRPPEMVLQEALTRRTLPEVVVSLMPAFPYYRAMLAQLKRYRHFAKRGGWPVVPEGQVLQAGDTDPRVAILRNRLAVEYGAGEVSDRGPQFYDAALEASVRGMQQRHGLAADGVVGPATLKVLNISAIERLNQIRVNLERARWLREELTDAQDLVMVNIAGFHMRLIQDGEDRWQSRVIVGTAYDYQTPVFAADMEYLVFNPTWTVPRSIVRDEMFATIQANPNYLASEQLDLLDSTGQRIDAATLDWTTISASSFPYTLVQQAGGKNALGRVKFMLPNDHAVYLHDTPARELFARAGRTFSHGCVRIENPLELATLLLQDQLDWTRAAIDQTIAGGKTTTVFLTEPLRVLILYWTAEPAADGSVRFYDDVYRRDGAVLQALNSPFRTLTPADRLSSGLPPER